MIVRGLSVNLYNFRSYNVALLFLLTLLMVKQVDLQMFVRDCNDPLIDVGHVAVYSHPYCEHICGFPSQRNGSGTATCNPAGHCICEAPCYQTIKDATPVYASLDICPPIYTDPPDTDPNSDADCQQTCDSECDGDVGGVGVVCGEVFPFTVGSNLAYARVCTCVCPVQQCPQISSNSNNETSNKPDPNPNPNNKHIIIYKNPYLKLLLTNIFLWINAVFWTCIILALFFLGLIIISLYYLLLSQFISFDLGQFLISVGLILLNLLINR